MRNDAHLMLMVLVATFAIGLYEVDYLTGGVAALVMAAAVSSALMFSLARRPEAVMSQEQQEVLEVKGFGIEGKATGKRILADKTLLLAFACVLAFGLYKHHTDNDAALTRMIEVIVENTYVLSLSQADREKLNISMPESLRRKIRAREQ